MMFAGLSVAQTSPPVFPTQWSAHTHTIAKTVGGNQVLDCDFAFDAVNNLTAYRNCKGPGQMVTRYDDKTFGTFGKHYHIGPPGAKWPTGMCQFWCDAQGDLQDNMEESLMSYDYTHRAKYDSSTTCAAIRSPTTPPIPPRFP